MKCIIVTPEKTVLDTETAFTVLPLIDGEYGIMPHHAPLVARLGAGELRITDSGGSVTNYYVEGGFAEVIGDTINLLTMHALPASELDVARAEEQLEKALARPGDTPELAKIRQEKIYSRRARLRVAHRVADAAAKGR
ncbi:MAG: ATP synthase F1 subunit epsilon [Planctomycetaceae bacterium]|jgi:F-type H+-transporting ATPase subunit epsilon|nr:ATP synthase F1 subunit epsilon [Planctomycetaceae bacterium]